MVSKLSNKHDYTESFPVYATWSHICSTTLFVLAKMQGLCMLTEIPGGICSINKLNRSNVEANIIDNTSEQVPSGYRSQQTFLR